jgi:DNA-binding response OmpR family regulator
MAIPAVKDPLHLLGHPDGTERLYAELQVVRRRLDLVVADLNKHRDKPEWAVVEEAAETALRALNAALREVPQFAFTDRAPAPVDFAVDDLTISVTERRAWLATQTIELSPMEFMLLVALAREPERVFTKFELLRDVWGYRSPGRTRTLDSHASRLRGKLRAAGAPEGRYVVSLWGVGYSLMRP